MLTSNEVWWKPDFRETDVLDIYSFSKQYLLHYQRFFHTLDAHLLTMYYFVFTAAFFNLLGSYAYLLKSNKTSVVSDVTEHRNFKSDPGMVR
jgi:hypothetical protein